MMFASVHSKWEWLPCKYFTSILVRRRYNSG
ncbi:hypothetical protein F01_250006 [Burkholderia cenocepacia]|nr:hypothetical protein F01_250006 [Burkholderia cenocepacia]